MVLSVSDTTVNKNGIDSAFVEYMILLGEYISVDTKVVMILADIIPDFNCNKVLSVNPFLLSI